MLRWIPDWILYALALGVVLWAVFSERSDDAPPPPPEAIEREGAMLPPPSAFDERVLVQVSAPKSGIGTAFAINGEGQWLTARHVVDGCSEVSLLVAPGQYARASSVTVSEQYDLALIETETSLNPAPINTENDLRIGSYGFHVGYPQGRPGEAASRLMARSNLISRGRRSNSESVLAWAETGRTRGLMGSLGGLSGGPVYDQAGNVRASSSLKARGAGESTPPRPRPWPNSSRPRASRPWANPRATSQRTHMAAKPIMPAAICKSSKSPAAWKNKP